MPTQQLVEEANGSLAYAFGSNEEGGRDTWYVGLLNPANGTFTQPASVPGGSPFISGLTLAPDGSLFAIASDQAYRITESLDVEPIYQFCSLANCADGTNSSYDNFPTEPIIGADGSLYGTTQGDDFGNGAVLYRLQLSPALQPPVSVSVSDGGLVTWASLNSFSLTMQQCYLFQNNNDGTPVQPLGKLSGALAGNSFGGTQQVTLPTAAGVYTYAVTCGGIESGFGSVKIGGGKADSVTLLTTNSPLTIGQPATLTVNLKSHQNIGPITGTVAFSANGESLGTVPLSNGSATITYQTSGVARGTYQVTAAYSGDANYQPSTGTTNVVLLGQTTSVTLSSSAATVAQGQPVTLHAAVARTATSGTPTGSVAFYAGTDLLGSAQLTNGAATYTAQTNGTIPAGTYAVTASYSGDSDDQPATSSAINETVLNATVTTLAVTPNPVPANSIATVTVTVAEQFSHAVPQGQVELVVNGQVLDTLTLSNGTAQANLSDANIPSGSYPLQASYLGSGADGASQSAAVPVKVQ